MSGSVERRRGGLFVLCGPSGVGKTSVAELAIAKIDSLTRSVSHTTRPIREGENNGVDYHFVTDQQFQSMVDDDDFIEWAKVHCNCYGTSIGAVKKVVEVEKADLVLVIDVQGAETLREKGINFTGVFLLPPSMEELAHRLAGRGDTSDDDIDLRMKNATEEMASRDKFDFQIINNNLYEAVEEFCAIITAEKLRTSNRIIKL